MQLFYLLPNKPAGSCTDYQVLNEAYVCRKIRRFCFI